MINTISLKCPECNANLSVDESLKQCFCQYCGTKIMLDDGSTNYVYRKVDEARIKEAEIRENIRLRELELEEKRYMDKKKAKSFKVKVSIVLAIIGILMMAIGFLGEGELFVLSAIGMWCCLAIAFLWNNNDKDGKE